MATFESSLKPRLIYIFAINDEWHSDCLKIGETTFGDDSADLLPPNDPLLQQAARRRIDQYTKTAGISYQLLHTEMTIFLNGGMVCSFNDKQVHTVLERSGIRKKVFDVVKGANEWFCCDLETAKKAIRAVKNGQTSLSPGEITTKQTPITFRPEQQKAIEMTIRQFRKGRQMLWNAKMRFGKTLSALEVVKRQDYCRTLILTHRPVVDEGWFKDFHKIFYDRPDFLYGSRNKGESFDALEKRAAAGTVRYVYFASMQDLRGSEQVGGKFVKNTAVFNAPWDLIIVDEAHEGTQTDIGKNVVDELQKADTRMLRLSGTPFKLLDDYSEDEIFTWDYVMEQRAKAEWDLTHMGDSNPYESLPAINIYTYDLGTLMSDYVEDEKAFNFREFFRTTESERFVHDADVDRFLNLLCCDDKESLYPYSCDTFRNIFRHTLWVVPGVKAARVLSAKLKQHPVFGAFQIVNVAGNGDEDEENADALQMVNNAIGSDPDRSYTITLSCGRLTTGVSIKPWTAVFMMAGAFSTSAAQYMQTIFRVQTPFTCKGRMKEQCYAFDFAPDRTLRVLAESAKVSAKAGKQTDEDRKILGDFLNFCPIISIDGSRMKPYDVNKLMGQLKKAQIEKVVQCGFEDGALYNDELLKLTEVDLKDFSMLKGIIGKTKAMKKTGDIDINRLGFTNEEYDEKERLERKKKKDLTPEEKERLEQLKRRQTQRKDAISILRGISIRMPLLIYGAELKDEEQEITIDNFANLIDTQSWQEFMPRDVTKEVFQRFKKYYDPDIFREAGKRIREMARTADRFTIEERIERIAAIFNTFRNPDKETVLTPWRVVNMHLSDCLGGWTFYDEKFSQVLAVPRWVDRGQVTRDVFRPEAHVLEINSKSGLYPLYVAYNIYRARVEAAKAKYGEVGHGFAMSLWDATVSENILVVCKTPMARSITRRTLAGFRDVRVNAQYYKDLIQNISEHPEAVVNTLRDGRRFWKINNSTIMKFDAIVGNPPYQLQTTDKGGQAIPLYNLFFDIAKNFKPHYVSMIMPSKFFAGGMGLNKFRNSFMNDLEIIKVVDYVNSKDCFPNISIGGGVCYTLWENGRKGKCTFISTINGVTSKQERYLNEFDVLVRYNEAIPILHKILNNGDVCISEIISPLMPFGLSTNFRGEKKETYYNNIKVLASDGFSYTSENNVTSGHEYINKYKVLMSKTSAEHAGEPDKAGQYKVFTSSVQIAPPFMICTHSYFVIGSYDNYSEAHNLLGYLKTKFVRFLVLMSLSAINLSKLVFSFVPLQDFTRPWTDADLYAKYGLTEDEIGFIERMIKPME